MHAYRCLLVPSTGSYGMSDLWLLPQVGFVIALAAEAAVPMRGLFGAWDQQSLSVFGASAMFLIACAAVRALTCCHVDMPAHAYIVSL